MKYKIFRVQNIKKLILCKTLDFFKQFNINFSLTELSPTTWKNNLELKKNI